MLIYCWEKQHEALITKRQQYQYSFSTHTKEINSTVCTHRWVEMRKRKNKKSENSYNLVSLFFNKSFPLYSSSHWMKIFLFYKTKKLKRKNQFSFEVWWWIYLDFCTCFAFKHHRVYVFINGKEEKELKAPREGSISPPHISLSLFHNELHTLKCFPFFSFVHNSNSSSIVVVHKARYGVIKIHFYHTTVNSVYQQEIHIHIHLMNAEKVELNSFFFIFEIIII